MAYECALCITQMCHDIGGHVRLSSEGMEVKIHELLCLQIHT